MVKKIILERWQDSGKKQNKTKQEDVSLDP